MKDEKFIYTMADVARFYNKTQSAIYKWQSFAGYPKHAHTGKGLINLKNLNDWFLEYFYGNADIASTMAEEKLRYQRARARREELLTQELEGKLVSFEELSQDLGEVLTIFKQRLMAWIKRLPPVLKMKEEKELMKILHEEVWQILYELSNGFKKIAEESKDAKHASEVKQIPEAEQDDSI